MSVYSRTLMNITNKLMASVSDAVWPLQAGLDLSDGHNKAFADAVVKFWNTVDMAWRQLNKDYQEWESTCSG